MSLVAQDADPHAKATVPQVTILDSDQEFARGAGVVIGGLTPIQVENLAKLGEVWGFLKYHDREVAAGKWHWDFELFRVLPAVVQAQSAVEANAVLAAWIDRLGVPAKPLAPKAGQPGPEVHLREEVDWLRDDSRWGAELGAKLRQVLETGPGDGDQFYVQLRSKVGNPIFAHELDYAAMQFPDDGYRLLALFRYWNIIRYWFPYRDLIAEDWRGVLTEFLPRLVAVQSADDYAREMMRLIARVHDSHANLWSSLKVRPPNAEATLPVRMRFVEGQLMVTIADPGDAERGIAVNLQVGDLVLAVDGRLVEDLVEEWRPLYAASNEWTRRRDMAQYFGGGSRGAATIRVRRGGEEIDVVQERYPWKDTIAARTRHWHDLPGPAFRLLSPEIGYLKLSAAKNEELDSYVESAKGTLGLVIDARGYPSAFTPFVLGGRLVENRTAFARFTVGVLTHPGRFCFTPPMEIVPRPPVYRGRVVVLIDECSQSSAEYQTMALRMAPAAKVIGSPSAGADGNVSSIPLPGGLRTMISGIGVFYPDKRPTQRIGIGPDIEVYPTIAGIRAGRDEVLEAALRDILGPECSDEAIRALMPSVR